MHLFFFPVGGGGGGGGGASPNCTRKWSKVWKHVTWEIFKESLMPGRLGGRCTCRMGTRGMDQADSGKLRLKFSRRDSHLHDEYYWWWLLMITVLLLLLLLLLLLSLLLLFVMTDHHLLNWSTNLKNWSQFLHGDKHPVYWSSLPLSSHLAPSLLRCFDLPILSKSEAKGFDAFGFCWSWRVKTQERRTDFFFWDMAPFQAFVKMPGSSMGARFLLVLVKATKSH